MTRFLGPGLLLVVGLLAGFSPSPPTGPSWSLSPGSATGPPLQVAAPAGLQEEEGAAGPTVDSILGPDASLEREGVRIVHRRADSLLAIRILEEILDLPPLPGVPGGRPRDVEVILAPDEDAYAAASGGRPPHWSAGVAIPSRSRIVLPTWTGSESLGMGREGLLRHEWAHLGVYQASGGLRSPRWFTEGYAEWAGGWDRTRAWRLRVLLALGRTPPLDSLSLDWPSGQTSAEGAYLLSASVVEYLHERSGDRGLEVLFLRWSESGSFEEGFRRTYGLTTGQMEEDWRAWARRRYGWLFVLTHSGLAWGGLTLLLLGLVSFRRRHDREQMARLRARELPEEPAWWDARWPGEATEDPEAPGASSQPVKEGGDER